VQVTGQPITPILTMLVQLREPGEDCRLSEQSGEGGQDRTVQSQAVGEVGAKVGLDGDRDARAGAGPHESARGVPTRNRDAIASYLAAVRGTDCASQTTEPSTA
jgi:hypothetical protein